MFRWAMLEGAILLTLGSLLFWNILPQPLFPDPYSTVLLSREGELLGARIAADGQWRFPLSPELPPKFETLILNYEDRWFYWHPGLNPVAMARALQRNWEAGRIVSGGSTITQQVIRQARNNPKRTYLEKALELILAFRLELGYSKQEILALYAAHAPFGGNVVGLEAAAWRWFNRPPNELSWGETATLAVLPNSPGLIFPGKNDQRLLEKRNRLLRALYTRGELDSSTVELACREPLPSKPHALPNWAPHLLQRVESEGQTQQRIRSSLRADWQQQATRVLERYQNPYRTNRVHNAAALVLDVHTGQARVYQGNYRKPSAPNSGHRVDVVDRKRSPGSVLKPLLYALALDEGLILPDALVLDVPTRIGEYSPENFGRQFAGALPASEALTRSLNVPAVRLLYRFGLVKFYQHLEEWTGQDLPQRPSHYGLTLILGGAESTLWEVCGLYANLMRMLQAYQANTPQSCSAPILAPSYRAADSLRAASVGSRPWPISPLALHQTFEALTRVERPASQSGWRYLLNQRRIAWKTGTSFGYRDAWAVGTDGRHVVGVWVGNASGEGRPGLTGIHLAAPILFDLFQILPQGSWPSPPTDDHAHPAELCLKSGWLASRHCPNTQITPVCPQGRRAKVCPYHQSVVVDSTTNWRVNRSCAPNLSLKHMTWFVLPTYAEGYYRKRNPLYRPLPPFHPSCPSGSGQPEFSFIYPRTGDEIYLPRGVSGQRHEMLARANHRNPDATLYWHLGAAYLGATRESHQMPLSLPPGKHRLLITDQSGARQTCTFHILARR